jgi:hypothetical protein
MNHYLDALKGLGLIIVLGLGTIALKGLPKISGRLSSKKKTGQIEKLHKTIPKLTLYAQQMATAYIININLNFTNM